MLRPLVAHDFEAWSEVRLRNVDWLTVWEPRRSEFLADPATDRDAFERRCVARDRERQNGSAYTLGLFFNNFFVGEVNINNVVREQCRPAQLVTGSTENMQEMATSPKESPQLPSLHSTI